MIAYVKGVLTEKDPTRIVIEAGGVGYELIIPLSTYERLPRANEEAKLLAWHCVREDDETLFGFATPNERTMFQKLVSVSGVGPKIAIAILSGGSIGELSMAIAAGNAKRLSSIKGVGKKTAEKICVELRDKVNALEAMESASADRGKDDARTPMLRDAILALGALGFNEETANKMVAEVIAKNADAADTETIIRLALSGGRK